MKPILVLLLALAPAPLWAGSAFEQMIGTWRGSGSYTEGATAVDLTCRFTITGGASAITMAGRCASSLGGDDFSMGFERGPNNTALVQSGASSRERANVDSMSGPLGRNGMVVKGAAGDEEITVQLLLNDDGTLVFATREVVPGKTSTSYVTLLRQ